jgi:hypothetical protein
MSITTNTGRDITTLCRISPVVGCRGLILTQQALESKGYHTEAAAINNIRSRENWSQYVVRLIKNIQRGVREFYDINKLRFLQYSSRLKAKDINSIKKDDTGVIWL